MRFNPLEQLSRFLKSAGFTIATNAGQPEANRNQTQTFSLSEMARLSVVTRSPLPSPMQRFAPEIF